MLLCSLLIVVAHAGALAVGPVPPWVESVGPDLSVPEPTGVVRPSVQYLLVDDQVYIDDQGTPSRFGHFVYRLVTHESLDELSRVEVSYDPDTTHLTMHELKVWRDGAWRDRLADARVAVIQREESLWQHIFDGMSTLVLIPEDIRVGDILSYSWTLDGYNPVFAGQYSESWEMAWTVPTDRRTLRVLHPVGLPLSVRVHSALPPVSTELPGGQLEERWDLRDVAAFDTPDDVPVDGDDRPWVQVSTAQTWADVVRWAVGLYGLEDDGGPEVARLAREIAPEDADDALVLANSLRWVQDEVRYFGIELGEGSHAPRPPAEVLRKRYGDCKDKSLLLVALLRGRGVDAWPALVHTTARASIASWLPAPIDFDHVIVAVQLDGRLVFVDPTRRNQGGPAGARYIPPYGKALLVREGETDLVDVTRSPAAVGELQTRYTYTVSDVDSSVLLDVHTCTEGGRAEQFRAWLADTTPADLQDHFLDYYRRPGVTVTPLADVEVQDDRAANRLCMDERYRVQDVWTIGEDGRELFQLWTPELLRWLPVVDDPDRQVALSLPAGVRESEEIVIIAPDDWRVEAESMTVDVAWFEYRFEVFRPPVGGPLGGAAGDQLCVLRHALQIREDQVPGPDLVAYSDARSRSLDRLGFELYRPAAGAPTASPDLVVATVLSSLFLGVPLVLLMAMGGVVLGVSWWARRNERRLRRAGR